MCGFPLYDRKGVWRLCLVGCMSRVRVLGWMKTALIACLCPLPGCCQQFIVTCWNDGILFLL